MADENQEGENFEIEVDGAKRSCTLITMESVGFQQWKATVRCPDGSTRTATSANQNQSKELACQQCS
jgi:hypothetical protein